MSRNVFVVRFGSVTYWDLCQWENVSREEFFKECDLKQCTVYGLIYETDDLVKVMWETDDSLDEEGGGIVIPKSCLIEMVIFDREITPADEEVDALPSVKPKKKLEEAN